MWENITTHIPKAPIWVQGLFAGAVPFGLMMVMNRFRSLLDRQTSSSQTPASGGGAASGRTALTGTLQTDIKRIEQGFARNGDVKIRQFNIKDSGLPAAVVYVEGLIHKQLVDEALIRPLMHSGMEEWGEDSSQGAEAQEERLRTYLIRNVLTVSNLQEAGYMEELEEEVLVGKQALLVEGMRQALLIEFVAEKSRNTEEPLSEGLLRGPRIGFVERLEENTGILRTYGKNPGMFIEKLQVGSRIKKELALVYMKDIARPELVNEVRRRVRSIQIDAVLESGYVEQFIEDDKLSPFQQVHNTERPDRMIGAILEGRVGILLDGTPFSLIVPATFDMLLQSPEDYYERWLPSSFLRILRFIAATMALFAPALYISFISYHPGLIPTKLVLSIIETRQGVPFPSIIEALIMEVSIEILREAGIRLPKPIGPAMGIVGGLIIGDAAVQAGIISPILVIVVAVTAISSFAIPTYSAGISLRMLRFAAMLSAAMLGLYGVVMFFLMLCIHICRLSSFGVPYSAPFVPYRSGDWKDFLIRAPLPLMKRRPLMMNPIDQDREPPGPGRGEA